MSPVTRAHAKCWKGDHYEHICQEPSGRACYEQPCDQPAGTSWGPYWCPDHDAERLNRISANLADIARVSGGSGASGETRTRTVDHE